MQITNLTSIHCPLCMATLVEGQDIRFCHLQCRKCKRYWGISVIDGCIWMQHNCGEERFSAATVIGEIQIPN